MKQMGEITDKTKKTTTRKTEEINSRTLAETKTKATAITIAEITVTIAEARTTSANKGATSPLVRQMGTKRDRSRFSSPNNSHSHRNKVTHALHHPHHNKRMLPLSNTRADLSITSRTIKGAAIEAVRTTTEDGGITIPALVVVD